MIAGESPCDSPALQPDLAMTKRDVSEPTPHHSHHVPEGRPLIADRRELVLAAGAIVCGGLAGAFPVMAGLPVVLSPLAKAGDGDGPKFLRVATLDALPADGTPVNVPVIADKIDAWTREADQPIGAVFLRRVGNEVECYNAICPHAGCMVGYAAERKCFQCPCHTSQFELTGARVMPSPSPRDMDKLVLDEEKLKTTGEIWVQFVNYYPGKEHPEPKA